ncbi:forkhead box protein I2-A-like [Anomaloglossus baeobatrachus]|uniref:forkhead box protein I2-A-like n=1 Tax=Anomaloglossus baeobatrachus TaxID=238106 RepID=UPI003F501CB6
MDAFGQHAFSSQLGYSYLQDLEDIEVFSGDHFDLHQQNQPLSTSSVYDVTDSQGEHDDPFWWLDDDFTNNTSSNFPGKSPRNLPSDLDNNQAQVLTPSAESIVPETPCLTQVNHDDPIKVEKPPYCLSVLIAMALLSAPEKKVTLRQIYCYLANNFPFYKKSKTNWKKAVRSKLNSRHCFKKVATNGCRTGRQNYWTFDPNGDKIYDDVNVKLKEKKCINGSKPSNPLNHKRNVKSQRSERLVASPKSKIMSSPALEASPCFSNLTSDVNTVRSDGASVERMEDCSSFEQLFNELSTYLTDYYHNSSLPGESIAQANLCEGLALPNQSSLVNPSQDL